MGDKLEVLYHRYLDGEKIADLAKEIGVPRQTLSSRLGRNFDLKAKLVDHTGSKFGMLKVLSITTERVRHNPVYICECDCGNIIKQTGDKLTRRVTQNKSCGCIRGELLDLKGFSSLRIYNIWRGMQQRCYSSKSSAYEHYGAKGFTLCEEWLGAEGFFTFIDWALDSGYDDTLTIERIKNHIGYKPSNCLWIPRGDQAYNKSNTVLSFEKAATIRAMRVRGETWKSIADYLDLKLATVKNVGRGAWET